MNYHETHKNIGYIQGGLPVCYDCGLGESLLHNPCLKTMKSPYIVPLLDLIVEENDLIDGKFVCEFKSFGDEAYWRPIDKWVNGNNLPSIPEDEELKRYWHEIHEQLNNGVKIINGRYHFTVAKV